eukprot:scaffold71657_cov64-Phaeocystis_antarctica.AAC.1
MARGGAGGGAGGGACLTKRSALSLRGSGSSASAMTATTAVRTSTLSCHRCAASKAASRDGGVQRPRQPCSRHGVEPHTHPGREGGRNPLLPMAEAHAP